MRIKEGNVSLTHDGTALAPYLRVTWNGSAVSAAGAAVRGHGTLDHRVLANDSQAVLVPFNAGGTRKMVASEALAKGATLYAAAGGKVTDTAGTVVVGIAMEAASGDNSIIEVLEIPDATN